jgi:RHS repeat-associated protein
MNCNGVINASDNTRFLLYLNDPLQYGLQHPGCDPLHGDMDGDGDTDWDDYGLFVDWLTGHSGAGGTRQVYAWDAENRLIAVGPPVEGPPLAGAKRATYAYDYLGRRIEKKVYTWQTTPPPAQWVLTEHRRFVWAGTGTGGWLMLMELNGLNNNAVLRQYTWGLDLAGQSGGQTSGLSGLEGAGGIGGLLAVEQPQGGGSSLNYVYFYDANGNVDQVIYPGDPNGAAASIKVKYEYDPYGTRTNSAQGGEFDQPFRFSTKYFDAETGLYYFGYRYYHPKLGRWMSRDPVGEADDRNLNRALRNRPIGSVDALGLQGTHPGHHALCGAFIVCPRTDIVVKNPKKRKDVSDAGLDPDALIGFEVIFLPTIPSQMGQYKGPTPNPQDCCCGCEDPRNIQLVQAIGWRGAKGKYADFDGASSNDTVPPGMGPPGRTNDGSSFEDGPYNPDYRWEQGTAYLEICAFCTVNGKRRGLGCFQMTWTHGTPANNWKDRKYTIKTGHLDLTKGDYKGCTFVEWDYPGDWYHEAFRRFPPKVP